MKKIAEKVALVALVCVTLVFVLTTPAVRHGRYSGGKQQRGYYSDERAYCRVCRFVRISFVRKLFRKGKPQRNSAVQRHGQRTHTSVKVVKNIVEGCARQVEGIEVRHVRIRADEKGGFVAIVSVKATAENVTPRNRQAARAFGGQLCQNAEFDFQLHKLQRRQA